MWNFGTNRESKLKRLIVESVIEGGGPLPKNFPLSSAPEWVRLRGMHPLMTIKETAEYLRMPLPTVYYLVQRGQLPAVQIGGRWRVNRKALDREVLHMGKAVRPGALVVESERSVQATFKDLLKKAGLTQRIVGQSSAGLALLEAENIDLCFLSVHLFEMPWREFYLAARKIRPALPIVLLVREHLPEEILSLGAVVLLRKPFEAEHFFQTLRLLGVAHRAQGTQKTKEAKRT